MAALSAHLPGSLALWWFYCIYVCYVLVYGE